MTLSEEHVEPQRPPMLRPRICGITSGGTSWQPGAPVATKTSDTFSPSYVLYAHLASLVTDISMHSHKAASQSQRILAASELR